MKITYRPEIDGLRAIAVVAVILYHARITLFGHQLFKGGFIGVDIFFVISGYLITSIILKELVTTGSFSFKHFYERRIRRILPALLFIMLVSLPFAWIFLLPSSFIDFSKSILYSLGFSSNFYFHYTDLQYGAEDGLLKPFLHTWSLSVEEQYYILFPIVLLITFKYFKKHLLTILVIGFIISLLMADWGSKNHPSFNFYVLPTRGWELIAGSILAYFQIQIGHRSKHQTLNLILSSIGLFLIGHSFLFFNDKMFHPSFYTLTPIIGVCLVIWFSNKDELITKILSSKLFVGTGLISYSLYLWHYPIFAFARITNFASGDITKKLIVGLVIVLLSIFTYFIIEKPSRDRNTKFKKIFLLIFISLLTLIIINISIIRKEGYKNKLSEFFNKNLTQRPWLILKNDQNETCFGHKDGCIFNINSNKKVFIIGDSQLASLTYDLKKKLLIKDYQILIHTIGGCVYAPGFDLISIKTQKIHEFCNYNYFSKLEKKLANEKGSIIIIGGLRYFYNNIYSKFVPRGEFDTVKSSFSSSIKKLSKENNVIFVYPIPVLNKSVKEEFLKQFTQRNLFKEFKFKFKNITISYEEYIKKNNTIIEMLNTIKNGNIYRAYPHKLLCNTMMIDKCVSSDNKKILYYDRDHPSPEGAEMINDSIIKEIEKIESKSN